jgi:hypothetical protein
MTKSQTNRALRLAYTGTTKQVDALEAEMGCALSTILDAAWDDAETAGDTALARRCERAFNHLIGK